MTMPSSFAKKRDTDIQLKKDLTEKLFKFLSEPDKIYQTYTGPTHPTTDEEFLKIFFEKFFDSYKQWKTVPTTDQKLWTFTNEDARNLFQVLKTYELIKPHSEKQADSPPLEAKDFTIIGPNDKTKDKANPKLLLENLLNLSNNRIDHLEKLLEKKDRTYQVYLEE